MESIFNENSDILKFLRIRQKEIHKNYHLIPDRVKFAKPLGLEVFMK